MGVVRERRVPFLVVDMWIVWERAIFGKRLWGCGSCAGEGDIGQAASGMWDLCGIGRWRRLDHGESEVVSGGLSLSR